MTMQTEVDLTKILILKGSHAGLKQPKDPGEIEACAMEWASVLANEPFGDNPVCVCPRIRAFVIKFNDSIRSDERRTELLRDIIPLTLNTRSTRAVEMRRAWMMADWSVRKNAPIYLRLHPEFSAFADQLEALSEIRDAASYEAARGKIFEVRDATRKAADAAYAAYAASAAYAAYAASAAYAADAADAAYAADAADAASAAYAAYAASAAYAAYAASAASAADAASAASAAYAAYAASAASAASAAYAAYAASAASAASAADAAYAADAADAAEWLARKKQIDASIAESQNSAADLIRRLCAVKEAVVS